jgi:general secretion pathway protein K
MPRRHIPGEARRTAAGTARQGGFVLLLVLWSISLLALLGAHVAATGRSEIALAANLQAAATAEALADGGVHEAIWHLLAEPGRRWVPDGTARTRQRPGGTTEIRLESEAGKIGLNAAPPELLRALFLRLGLTEAEAGSLAAAILDWRSPGQRPRIGGAKEAQYRAAGRDYAPPLSAFRSLDELGLVLGMTPDLLARARPYLSVHAPREPDLRRADRLVVQTVMDVAGPQRAAFLEATADRERAEVVMVTVRAATAGPRAARFVRRAEIGLRPGAAGRSWRILSWDAVGE